MKKKNREIKFRAWDEEKKVMYYNVGISPDGIPFLGKESLYWILNGIPMQFTGLFDKKGKAIYEGDILKFTLVKIWGFHCTIGNYKNEENKSYQGIIEWREKGWYLAGYEYPTIGYLTNVSIANCRIENCQIDEERATGRDHAIFENFKVIGNIYENQELLIKK